MTGTAALADFAALLRAVAADDIDAALRLGLLEWAGDDAPARAAGLDANDILRLRQARDARLRALAARARFRAREARLARVQAERRQRQADTLATGTSLERPALTGAAAAALARALARAKR